MVAELKSKAAACPTQKYVLGGHSQGGMVTVGAIRRLVADKELPKDVMSRIIAVTMFGSPACPAAVRDRCKSFCHKGDFVCDAAAKGRAPKLPGGVPSVLTPDRLVERSLDAAECPKDVPESGYVAKAGLSSGVGPHLSYNSDGYYVKAAACYIYDRFKQSK
jgi:Cutinase